MKEYLSIREFAKLANLDSSTLRYWDEIGLFFPAKRNEENNYRYYVPEQIIAVNFIKVLSSLQIPLKTIKELISDRNPESIMRLIEQQEKVLDLEMNRLRECYSVIHTRSEMINYGMRVINGFYAVEGIRQDSDIPVPNSVFVDVNEVAVLHREDTAFILGEQNVFKPGGGFYIPFIKFCQHANDNRINLSFPVGGFHSSLEAFLKAPGEPEQFLSMDPTGNHIRPVGNYVIGFHRGYYGEFGDLPERLVKFIKDNNLNVSGPVYALYLHDEVSIKNPNEYLVQVCIAVTKE